MGNSCFWRIDNLISVAIASLLGGENSEDLLPSLIFEYSNDSKMISRVDMENFADDRVCNVKRSEASSLIVKYSVSPILHIAESNLDVLFINIEDAFINF